jgi:PAS domain-containing protein
MTHNASEQRRAKRINEQISSLRQLMKATGMLGDKNDKGSILESASTFIQRAMAAESTAPPASLPVAKPAASAGVVSIDYASVFQSNGVAQAIAAMDGSFVDCNKKFCELSGFSRHEIRQRSIFNMTPQSDLQRTFEIVSAMMNSVGGSGERRCSSTISRPGTPFALWMAPELK